MAAERMDMGKTMDGREDEPQNAGGREYLGRWREEIRKTWDSLGEGTRSDLLNTLNIIPSNQKGWGALIDQSIEHMHFASGRKQYVAIVGPANVGKSTLYNQFVRSSLDESEVSAIPGTTKETKESDAGLFDIVDTPGMDAVGAVGMEEKEKALTAAKAADVIVLLFDASQGIRKAEKELFDEIMALDRPTVVGLNKIDLVRKERGEILGKAAAGLGIHVEQIIPLSAKDGTGVDLVLIAVAKKEPEIVAALGAALPEYRWDLSRLTIGRAASTAGAIAIAPLPFISFIPILGIQTALIISIARIYDYKITAARAKELIAVFGIGMMARTLFYELIKLGGPPAWAVSAAVAAGTTVAIGYGASVWFERGARISVQSMRNVSKAVSTTVLERLRGLGRRRPGEATLRERVYDAIEEMDELDLDEA